MSNGRLTMKVKEYAYSLGADLVGIAGIGRFANAPVMMSPQGILPSAKSVIVCAVHHPDACIELGGVPEPQDIGPYAVQYVMNDRLDLLSFRVARFLEDKGYAVVPIASSNIWRYRPYKDLDAVFAPDISHIYAAVAAGLSEIGWNGLSLTPEYGARNRFVSIITDAELEEDPLYQGVQLCDRCGECIRHCPTDAYRKEVNGVKTLKIEDREYRFANKNLWRCAWGEHFDLDLNLEIPEKVDEQTIIENVKKHGLRCGEFGSCLRYCLPPHLRVKDPDYTSAGRRKKQYVPSSDMPVHRALRDKLCTIASGFHLDRIAFVGGEAARKSGAPLDSYLPEGKCAVVLGIEFSVPDNRLTQGTVVGQYRPNAQFALDFSAYDICRELENLGYAVIMGTFADSEKLAGICGFQPDDEAHGVCRMYETVITSADFPESTASFTEEPRTLTTEQLTSVIRETATEAGADLVGVAPAGRIDALLSQLRKIRDGEELFVVKDKNPRFYPYDPIVTRVKRHLTGPSDYIDGAKSVIVIGLHYPRASVERAGQPPAEAVGPYVFAQYESLRILGNIAFSVVKCLGGLGYHAVYSYDLMSLGSMVGSPRGPQYDNICNSVEAVAAGLGELAYNGLASTKEYGTDQRFIAIVTDADLDASQVCLTGETQSGCKKCMRCIKACPAGALRAEKITRIELEGASFDYLPVETCRCDWSSKYALCGDDGYKYIGSELDVRPPETIDEESLRQALKQMDPVQKYRPVTAERCIVTCPLAGGTGDAV